MNTEKTGIPDLLVMTPRRFGDERGFFAETWNARKFTNATGVDATFVQDNHSFSSEAGTIRGLHFQKPPNAQGKLVRCGRGALLDVAVDIRKGSPTYGAWASVELSAENGKQLWVPEGFAHGFITKSASTEIVYKCTGYYAPEAEGAVHWASLDIDWGIHGNPIISDKDASAPDFAQLNSPFEWSGM